MRLASLKSSRPRRSPVRLVVRIDQGRLVPVSRSFDHVPHNGDHGDDHQHSPRREHHRSDGPQHPYGVGYPPILPTTWSIPSTAARTTKACRTRHERNLAKRARRRIVRLFVRACL
jgi:hypothetical protein